MTLFALAPLWNDVYTAGGFWIAIVQIREARKIAEAGKKAAESAAEAANKTLAESKDAYERFVGAFGSRLLSELEVAVGAKDWRLARFRCNDLAELLASLPTVATVRTAENRAKCVLALRELALGFANLETKQSPKMPNITANKWAAGLQLTHVVLDRLRKPFRETNDDHNSDGHAAPQTSSVGTRTVDPNQGPSGELGTGAEPE